MKSSSSIGVIMSSSSFAAAGSAAHMLQDALDIHARITICLSPIHLQPSIVVQV
jgi:hypothetical protein